MKILLLLLFCVNGFASSYNAELALDAGDYDKALELVNEIKKTSPDYKEVDFIKARIALQKGEYDDAEELIESALKLNKTAKVYNLAAGVYGAQAQNSSIFSKLGYAKKSKKHLLKAYKAEPDNKDYIIGLLLFNMQAPGIAGGDSEQIEPLLQELEKLDQNSATQLRIRYIVEEEGNDDALNYINEKITEDSENLHYKFLRAVLFNNMKQFENAYQDFSQVIAVKPADWQSNKTWRDALYQLGKLASIQNKWLEQGKESFIEYLNLEDIENSSPKAWATYRLGLIFQHLKQEELATEAFKKSSMMDPGENLKKLLSDLN